MARKNKIVSASTAASSRHAVYIGALVVLAGVMSIVNVFANTSCKRLQTSIGEKERELRKLEEDYQRESVRLSALHTPEKLARSLRLHGMAMNIAKPHQIIKMSTSGRPYPGQMALGHINSSSRATARYTQHKR
ncbi:MAG: hypothetical protein J6S51_03595 [Kiritimatiellae bacterium]|nr:hypothetical protein [Kiritimatiellia bacterium]